MSSVPSYTDSSYSLTTSPPYSSCAADGERVLEPRRLLVPRPADLPDHYIFESQRIKLDLGPRMWSTSSPCYGHTGIVAGTVHLSDLNHIKQVNVTLEATAKTGFNERGTQTCCAEKVLFRRITTLSPTSASVATPTTHYVFSFTLPANQDNATDALPPSVVQFSASNSAEIRYRICVDAIRSGLRRRESLVVPILYLPRSYTPLMTRPAPFGNKIGLLPEDSLKELHLVPKFLTKSISKDKLSSKTDVGAKIALPSLLLVASGDKIPFVLTIYSEAPALATLYTNVIFQLIKIVKIKAHEKSSVKETVISSAEVYDVDQRQEKPRE
ncbi:hypothetical protein FRC12_012046 [Ceratobasidium sp. 428]|nr:hypothetical protein FRC12_012046 [Ceratobasidium sp. 428]